MADHSTINRVENAGKRYLDVSESVMSSWRNHCGCKVPGGEIKCHACPYFIDYVQQLQFIVDPDGKEDLAVLLPKEVSPPYSEEFRRRCLSMFESGYGVSRIKELTGVNSLTTLRRWLEREGLY